MARADHVVCGANEKCREVNLSSLRLLPQPTAEDDSQGTVALTWVWDNCETHPPPVSMTPSVSHQKARGIARQAQGRDGYRLAPPEEIVGCMSSPDTPHTRTQASTEGRQQG